MGGVQESLPILQVCSPSPHPVCTVVPKHASSGQLLSCRASNAHSSPQKPTALAHEGCLIPRFVSFPQHFLPESQLLSWKTSARERGLPSQGVGVRWGGVVFAVQVPYRRLGLERVLSPLRVPHWQESSLACPYFSDNPEHYRWNKHISTT